ncbi:hypothetical protein [Streptomyces mirabilis]|uniref:hypothetical protein n=1 Tax=Streptomyces mirabilis TaxID=68239 RepID=UPI0036C6C44E
MAEPRWVMLRVEASSRRRAELDHGEYGPARRRALPRHRGAVVAHADDAYVTLAGDREQEV